MVFKTYHENVRLFCNYTFWGWSWRSLHDLWQNYFIRKILDTDSDTECYASDAFDASYVGLISVYIGMMGRCVGPLTPVTRVRIPLGSPLNQ